ncbi:gliding motility lipoprotein GldH [Algoriphagus sediminis]|uniref:Gliding motility lipoprotein GldH n=1 Tax=Algoriphagus sediminis TaxID=3057113 RepID=A0ABT7Y9T4_9BACT|nr:gliding motility lipoprotein GldH [Algoriphagus sediminis]MDN3203283.1 gliding motility lipoprotein GldH [Algoriphagus sediminis]
MNRIPAFLIFLGVVLFSCDGNRVYEQFEEVPNQLWGFTDTIHYELQNLDSAEHFLVSVRFNEDYPYTNIYLKLLESDSSGTVLEEKLVNVILFDPKSGKPLGNGFGGTRTLYDTLDYKINMNASGLDILQYMRVNQLKGIEAVGFKATK